MQFGTLRNYDRHLKGTCFHELVLLKLGVSDPFLDDICSQTGESFYQACPRVQMD